MTEDSKKTTLFFRGRIMHPSVHEKHIYDRSKPDEGKYIARIVLHKEKDKDTLARIYDTGKMLVDTKLDGVMPQPGNWVLKEYPDKENLKDCFVINAKSDYKPDVVGMDKKPIEDPEVPADGDYCYFEINLFAYSNQGKGVNAYLNKVYFLRKGEGRLSQGGGMTIEEGFALMSKEDLESAQMPGMREAPPRAEGNPFVPPSA